MNAIVTERRLASIEQRLAVIEQLCGVGEWVSTPISVPVRETVLPIEAPTPPTVTPPTVTPPPIPVPAWVDEPSTPQSKPARPADPLEQTIGLKWAGWVGAVVLTIGAALGIKFAYDQHWFELVSPAARLVLMSLASAALLAAGEVVYRRVNRMSAASLFGAGVALAFLVAYAGHGYYDLYGRDTAFGLMAFVTLLGAGVAVRGGLVPIAVLSLIGGNLAPLILRSDHPRLVPFLAYLTMLQLVALSLSTWGRSGGWRVLRGLSLTTTSLWLAGLLVLPGGPVTRGAFGATFNFMLLSAVLFHAEAIAATWLTTSPRRGGATTRGESAASATAGFTVLVTALLTVGLLHEFGEQSKGARTALIFALAGLAAAAAWGITHLRRLWPGHDATLRPLSTGYLLQATGLAVAAAPVALSGVWLTVAWATMGVTLAAAGAALDLKRCRRAAVVVWVLAGVQLLAWSTGLFRAGPGAVRPGDAWVTYQGHVLPAWSVAAASLALTGHVIGSLVTLVRVGNAAGENRGPSVGSPSDSGAAGSLLPYAHASLVPRRFTTAPDGEERDLATFADVVSSIVWLCASLAALPALGATAAVAAYGMTLIVAGRFVPQPRLTTLASAALVFAAGKWLVVDTTLARLLPAWSALDRPTLLNAQAAVGVGLVAALAAASRLAPKVARTASPSLLLAAAAACLLWTGSIEIDRAFERAAALGSGALHDPLRAKQVAISVFWALAASGCVVAGFSLRAARLRVTGLTLLGLTLAKVVVVDLAQVQTGYRVLSFVALGLLLLATSVLYGRLAPKLAGREEHGARGQ